MNIDYNKIYKSNKYGYFKIIEDCGRNESSHRIVKIKFIDSGHERNVRLDHAISGNVRDELYGIYFDKEYNSTKFGKFKIIKFLGTVKRNRMVEIEFINTGYKRVVRIEHALAGKVIDNSLPQVLGVGYCKNSNGNMNWNDEERKLYSVWHAMLRRCYMPPEEFIKYNTLPKTMVTIVNKNHIDN